MGVWERHHSTMGKDYFGFKCIRSYYVPVQTIVYPYDANCVTPLIYPTTDLDFLFWIIVSFDLRFYFLFFKTCTQPFCKRHYPVIVITITRHVLYTGKCIRLYVLEIIKAWPLCILWTRGHAYLLMASLSYIKLKRLDNDIKTKSISKTCTNYETKGKPRKKSHIPVSNPNLTKARCAWSDTVQRRCHSATLPSISDVL